jgi:hypothetical protein
MSTAYVSGRVPARYERLNNETGCLDVDSDLVAGYVIEKIRTSTGISQSTIDTSSSPSRAGVAARSNSR